jgi:signal peptidase I
VVEEVKRRGLLARIGICALNGLLPGLGLVRLARYRSAALFFVLLLVSFAVILGGYFLIEQMRFGEWVVLISALVTLALAAYLGSIVATWHASRTVEPRFGIAWRWYGLIAIWLVWALASSPITDLSRSRYRAFYTPSASMMPTFQVHDRILADMHDIGPLERGDVVIVHANGEDYVKRIAGLPGDKISLTKGTVMLNGKPVDQQPVGKARYTDEGQSFDAMILRERFPGEAKPHLVMDTGPSFIDDLSETTLPPGRYFLLGDNRDHSADSRLPPGYQAGLGPVPRNQITGSVAFRYWRSGVGLGSGQD